MLASDDFESTGYKTYAVLAGSFPIEKSPIFRILWKIKFKWNVKVTDGGRCGGLTRTELNSVPRSTRLQRPLFLQPRSYSYQARFKVQKGIYLTILDEAYVSKIAVLRETNLQDCNPAGAEGLWGVPVWIPIQLLAADKCA